jgi:hypothetical protein
MLLIPEIETVVILVPRTGSGSLYRSVLERYPRTIMPYRHMEADGVPAGYDRWRKVGVVRNPLDRLWSLYKWLPTIQQDVWPDGAQALRKSVDMPFEQWLLHNDTVFCQAYYTGGRGPEAHAPFFTTRNPIPENRKSQFIYLRPDLGTKVFRFDDLDALRDELGLAQLGHKNATPYSSPGMLSAAAWDYLNQVFDWDFRATELFCNARHA